jgi:hypothetical protein
VISSAPNSVMRVIGLCIAIFDTSTQPFRERSAQPARKMY